MPVGVPARTSQYPVGSAVARLCPAALVEDLTVANLPHELPGTMPGGAAGLGRFRHNAAAYHGMAMRWRDER